MGAQMSSEQLLLFIDADVMVVDPQRFTAPLAASTDLVVDSPYAFGKHEGRDPEYDERGLRGTHFVTRELFERVQGFNPHMRGWGFEDFDLYHRYAQHSPAVAYYERASLHHQPHGDRVRRELQAVSLRESVRVNRAVADNHLTP
jgi:hypothetical protein